MLSSRRFVRLAAVTLIAFAAFPPSALGQAGGAQPQRARPAPATQRSADSVHSIATGSRHTCALMGSGAVYCWGHDIGRYDGSRSARAIARPTRVTPAPPFTTITAYSEHVCGLTASGEAWCWGANEWGQAGNGPGVEATGRERANLKHQPGEVSGDVRFAALAPGGGFTCGLGLDASAWCWGTGARVGQQQWVLGTSVDKTLVPVRVEVPGRLIAVEANSGHACALTEAGEAWCWGANTHGQLGQGTITLAAPPAAVQTELRFRQLAVGALHTCGLTTTGRIACWGDDQFRQVGGTTPNCPGQGTLRCFITPVVLPALPPSPPRAPR